MNEEQAEQFICDYLANVNGPFDDPEELRENINQEIVQQGWEVKSIKSFGRGFSFNVKPVDNTSFNVKPVDNANTGGGLNCTKCKSFNAYAEANQPDGTYICYSCRS